MINFDLAPQQLTFEPVVEETLKGYRVPSSQDFGIYENFSRQMFYIAGWVEGDVRLSSIDPNGIIIYTPDGPPTFAAEGDYIVKSAGGDFFVVRPQDLGKKWSIS